MRFLLVGLSELRTRFDASSNLGGVGREKSTLLCLFAEGVVHV